MGRRIPTINFYLLFVTFRFKGASKLFARQVTSDLYQISVYACCLCWYLELFLLDYFQYAMLLGVNFCAITTNASHRISSVICTTIVAMAATKSAVVCINKSLVSASLISRPPLILLIIPVFYNAPNHGSESTTLLYS